VVRAELPKISSAEQIVAMSAVGPRRWTRREVDHLIDERPGYTPRYELVGGELLVTPGPNWRHQRIIGRLFHLLLPYVTQHQLGDLLLGPAELPLVTGELYEPDLFVVPTPAGRLRAKPAGPIEALLVCETLSPGSSRHDRITKRRAFQRNHVPDYWIVDGEAEVFETWRPADERPAVIDERLTWLPIGATVPFELDVREFFASVADTPETK